jgi:transposase
MDHVAIDLGARKSQICRRRSDATIEEERSIPTMEVPPYLRYHAQSGACRVVLETCSEAFRIADAALEIGHEVRVVPGTLVRSLGVGSRRTKTDKRDAQILSEVSCRIDLPSVHIPSRASRERKTLCAMREALVGSRTKLINTVRGWMRAQGMTIRSGGAESFAARVRERATKDSIDLPSFVDRQLTTIELLSAQLSQADREVKESAESDPVCRRLMTVPGVGPATATRFAAALDVVSRFPNAHAVESYLGLVPGEDSSSERQRRTSITKAGPATLRCLLVQAAHVIRRVRPEDPLVQWSRQIEQRRGKRIAIVAVARKLAGILFALWRDSSAYRPERASSFRVLEAASLQPIPTPLGGTADGRAP